VSAHIEIIKLIIAWALTGSFLFTLIVTCLSLINVVKSIDRKLRNKFVSILIVEVAVIAVGSFSDALRFDPAKASNIIKDEERGRIAVDILQSIAPAGNLSNLQIYSPESRAKAINTLSVIKKISPQAAGSEADNLMNYLSGPLAYPTTRADSANFARNVGNHLAKIEAGLKLRR